MKKGVIFYQWMKKNRYLIPQSAINCIIYKDHSYYNKIMAGWDHEIGTVWVVEGYNVTVYKRDDGELKEVECQ